MYLLSSLPPILVAKYPIVKGNKATKAQKEARNWKPQEIALKRDLGRMERNQGLRRIIEVSTSKVSGLTLWPCSSGHKNSASIIRSVAEMAVRPCTVWNPFGPKVMCIQWVRQALERLPKSVGQAKKFGTEC